MASESDEPEGAIKYDEIRETVSVRYKKIDGSGIPPEVGEDGHFRRLVERLMNAISELQDDFGIKVEVKYP